MRQPQCCHKLQWCNNRVEGDRSLASDMQLTLQVYSTSYRCWTNKIISQPKQTKTTSGPLCQFTELLSKSKLIENVFVIPVRWQMIHCLLIQTVERLSHCFWHNRLRLALGWNVSQSNCIPPSNHKQPDATGWNSGAAIPIIHLEEINHD